MTDCSVIPQVNSYTKTVETPATTGIARGHGRTYVEVSTT